MTSVREGSGVARCCFRCYGTLSSPKQVQNRGKDRKLRTLTSRTCTNVSKFQHQGSGFCLQLARKGDCCTKTRMQSLCVGDLHRELIVAHALSVKGELAITSARRDLELVLPRHVSRADFLRGTLLEMLPNRRKVLPRLTYHVYLIRLRVGFCDRLKLSSWWRINELLEQWHIPLLPTPYNEALEVLIDASVFLFCNYE
jgi:hypothetical protein